MILVSSCLAGLNVRYDGSNCLQHLIQTLILEEKAISVCPEMLGGFSTPREPAEIVGGNGHDVLNGTARVIEKSGRDVTSFYLKGAHDTLHLATMLNATVFVLKENSPSCGSGTIYDGQFVGRTILGEGVTTALIRRHGIKVISENELPAYLASI